MHNIPFVDLKAGFKPVKDEVLRALESVFDEMSLNNGPNLRSLEQEFANYCNTGFAVAVASGTEALHFALLACGVKPGDEVITTPNTFFATVEAIVHSGARPVFVDIDLNTYTMDPNLLASRISSKTKVIIPVHMYGQTAGMSHIKETAGESGIHVIEDACQAHGALYNEKKAGSMAKAGCFSFYFTKNLGAYGEGGIVTTSNEEIANKIMLYRNHGHTSKFEHHVSGFNGRMDELQAAILRIKLKRLEDYNNSRRELADNYNALLKNTPLILPSESKGRRHVYHLYVVRHRMRDSLMEHLNKNGIGTGIHYKIPAHLQEAVKHLGYKKGDYPVTETAASEILSLPMYPELTTSDQEYIAEKIKEFFN